MDQRIASGVFAWRQPIQLMLLVASLSIVLPWLAWKTISPRWNAPGYPSFVGYPKNVEHAALLLFGGGALAAAFVVARHKLPWWSLIPPIAAAVAILLQVARPEAMLVWPILVFALGLYFTWLYNRNDAPEPAPHSASTRQMLAIGLIYTVAGYCCLTQVLAPAGLDLFHQGEVALTARDWLAGGQPYQTMFWPHGMHDSWLAAQCMRATGNLGLGAVLLARALTHMLGLCGLGWLITCLIRRPLDAAVMTLAIAIVLPGLLYVAGISFFAIASLLVLVRGVGYRSCYTAGAMLGWAYLWRFETGLFALVGGISWLVLQAICRDGNPQRSIDWSARPRSSLRNLAGKIGLLFAGVTSLFVLTRLVIGLPTLTMLKTTLLELPRYHADNTGFPLPLPIEGFQQYTYGAYLPLRWLTYGFLLFAVALAAFLFNRGLRGQLTMASPANAAFLAFIAYGLLNLKTGLDRVGPCHLFIPIAMLSLPILLDGYRRLGNRINHGLVRVGFGLVLLTAHLGTLPDLLGPVEAGLLPFSQQLAHACHNARDPRPAWQSLRLCLQPTTTWPDLLVPSRDVALPQVTQGIRELRTLLEAHGIAPGQFVAVHSGPLIYVLLDRQSPTSYYLLGWAMNDRMERKAVDELTRHRVSAVLRVNGVGKTLPTYDVPDAHRIPRIHEFLQDKTAAALGYITPLGTLWVPPRGQDVGAIAKAAAGVVANSTGDSIPIQSLEVGYVEQVRLAGDTWRISGWSCSLASGLPVDELLVLVNGRCVARAVPHAPRPDVAQVLGRAELVDVGFDLVLPLALLGSSESAAIDLVGIVGNQAGVLKRIGQAAYELAERP